MKKIIRSLSCVLIFSMNSFTQNVGIGVNNPSAKLEIRSLSTLNYPTILLYDDNATNFSRISFQNSGGPKFWTVAGFSHTTIDANSRLNFYNSSYGDVMTLTGDGKAGIGVIPTERLDVNGNINLSGTLKFSNNAGLAGQVLTSNGTLASWQNLPASTNSWNVSGNNIYNNNSGLTGIGYNAPQAKLDVRHTSSFTSPTLLLYDNSAANFSRLQFQNASGPKFWNISALIDNANDANSTLNIFHSVGGDVLNATGNGRIGLGIATPLARMHIKFNSTVTEPQLQLEENGNDYTRMVFSSTSKTTSWTLGGLATSTAANDKFNIYHSTAGDVLSVSGAGKVTIGGANPTNNAKLDVQGGNINTDAKVTRTSTGTNNLVPIAYGFIRCSGDVISGTGNFTVVGTEPTGCGFKTKTITVNGEFLAQETNTVIATPSGHAAVLIANFTIDGKVSITSHDFSGNISTPFVHFVIYKN